MCSNSELSPSLTSIIEVGTILASCSHSTISARGSGFSILPTRYFWLCRSGCILGFSRNIFFSRSSNWRPRYAAPRSPDTHIRSFTLAPLRVIYLSGATSPIAVTLMTKPILELVVSPPIRSTLNFRRRHIPPHKTLPAPQPRTYWICL